MMKSRIAIAVSALTLGTALAATPSFAQTYGQSKGSAAAPQQSDACVHFGTACSDRPYPMANQSETGQSGVTRSASSTERASGQRLSSGRSSSEQYSGERVAQNGERGTGETFGFAERDRYYNQAPGAEVAAAGNGSVEWCTMRFRSFDPATGTYMGFDGLRHPCP